MNTIVFVEDDAEVGALIAAYLAKHDMQVTVEPRGDQAEETILHWKWVPATIFSKRRPLLFC